MPKYYLVQDVDGSQIMTRQILRLGEEGKKMEVRVKSPEVPVGTKFEIIGCPGIPWANVEVINNDTVRIVEVLV